jgi:geranylgeranyl diphosphate synthase type II
MPESEDALATLSGHYFQLFEDYLGNLLDTGGDGVPPRLRESMAYSLRAGGKRLRPILCLAAAERSGVGPQKALPMAAAIEFIHTASLIHDDMPCMDDDDLRRGKPTNHRAFGEAMALIAGDALLIWAFSHALTHLPRAGVSFEKASKAVAALAEASGPSGMCGGQILDTDRESQSDDDGFVHSVASAKTGALIRASVVTGALLGDISDTDLRCYYDYGSHLGLAFQIVDDILDVTRTREELGKTPHKDEAQGKITFVSAYGLEGAQKLAAEASEEACRAIEELFPEGDLLIDLAKSLADRKS